MNRHTSEELKALQALPLHMKVQKSVTRIIEWIRHWGADQVVISFSGGKDSTVLADLCDKACEVLNIAPLKRVFADTGLELKENKKFAKEMGAQFEYPKKRVKYFDDKEKAHYRLEPTNFIEVIQTYGYPVISKEVSQVVSDVRKYLWLNRRAERSPKQQENLLQPDSAVWTGEWVRFGTVGRIASQVQLGLSTSLTRSTFSDEQTKKIVSNKYDKRKYKPLLDAPFLISEHCCQAIKKSTLNRISKYPITGVMAQESERRTQGWIRAGCNAFEGKTRSNPLSFWLEQDILEYIRQNGLKISEAYGEVVEMSGKRHVFDGYIAMCLKKKEQGNCNNCNKRCRLETTGVKRSGCAYCLFGAHRRDDYRLLHLKETDRKIYDWVMGGGEWREVSTIRIKDKGVPFHESVEPKRMWFPNKDGLGLKFVIDWLNVMFGDKNKDTYIHGFKIRY